MTLLPLLTTLFSSEAFAVSPRWSFSDAYHHIDDGNWYRGHDNTEAILGWGEAYVMMSIAAIARKTGSPEWLDQLAWHADAALEKRDNILGTNDYRGVSQGCWQNTHYQSGQEPYCYTVHTGMITYPIAEYARIVIAHDLAEEIAYDGLTFGEKATSYIEAAEQSVAAHEDQWSPEGYYVFRTDATFLSYPGRDLPFNMSNAMGRVHLVLYDITGKQEYLTKATALAERFRSQITESKWNYWGEEYIANGEDISHAAINVDFAAMCAERGIVFTASDMQGIADNFMENIYIDDVTFSDWIGGGSTNNPSYLSSLGRWLRLAQWKTGVYTAIRDLFEQQYPGPSTGAPALVGWAMLAEFEPPHCEHFFYYVDWEDTDPDIDGNSRIATDYSPNILTIPPDLSKGCIIPLTMHLEQQITMGQWDGGEYHRIAEWQPMNGARFLPYEPEWPYIYWSDGVLFQFADPTYTGEGITVQESVGMQAPSITSIPPEGGMVNETIEYQLNGSGDQPYWWSLGEFPSGARIDAATGLLTWTASQTGEVTFTVLLENASGQSLQTFAYKVEDETGDSADEDSGETMEPEIQEPEIQEPVSEEMVTENDQTKESLPTQCGCSTAERHGQNTWLWIGVTAMSYLRRRKKAFTTANSRNDKLR